MAMMEGSGAHERESDEARQWRLYRTFIEPGLEAWRAGDAEHFVEAALYSAHYNRGDVATAMAILAAALKQPPLDADTS